MEKFCRHSSCIGMPFSDFLALETIVVGIVGAVMTLLEPFVPA